jgi:hypothetical protein
VEQSVDKSGETVHFGQRGGDIGIVIVRGFEVLEPQAESSERRP